MFKLHNDLVTFFNDLDSVSTKNINTFNIALNQCHKDSNNDMFINFLNKWNNELYKETWFLFVDFCKKYNIDLSIINKVELEGFKKQSYSKTYINKPNGYDTLKAIAGRAVYWMKNINKPVTDEIITVIVINTINQFCQVGKFLIECSLNISMLENYFWNTQKITAMVNDIKNMIDTDFIDIKDNTNNFGKTIGFELPEMTREWLIETIGDEKSYSKAINKIRQRNPVSRRAIQWAIEKTGVDKELNLIKRQYKPKEEQPKTEPVKESGFQIKSDIEDYNPANSIIEESEKKSLIPDEFYKWAANK